MNLLRRLEAPFVGGAIAALCFLVTAMLDAAAVGIGLVCLIAIIQGALPRHELMTFVAGVLAMMVVFAGLGLVFGNSIAVVFVMGPFLTALILFYATSAFFIGMMGSRLWRKLSSRSCN